jgi:hypothetical protein
VQLTNDSDEPTVIADGAILSDDYQVGNSEQPVIFHTFSH